MIYIPILLLTLWMTVPLWGADAAVFEFHNPGLEARFQQLTKELRCLVCQNQSLADSHADLAGDLRRQIYQMLMQGATDEQIIDFMVQRYGQFVLYRPLVTPTTYLLWLGPAIALLGGMLWLALALKQRAKATLVLPEPEHQRLRALLEEEDS